jgi:hypothetical protein
MKKALIGLSFGIVGISTIMMTALMPTNGGEPLTAERCYDAGFRDGQYIPFIVTTYQECNIESKFVDGQN